MDHHIKTDTQGNQTNYFYFKKTKKHHQNLKFPEHEAQNEAIPFLAYQSLAKFSASLGQDCSDLLNASNH